MALLPEHPLYFLRNLARLLAGGLAVTLLAWGGLSLIAHRRGLAAEAQLVGLGLPATSPLSADAQSQGGRSDLYLQAATLRDANRGALYASGPRVNGGDSMLSWVGRPVANSPVRTAVLSLVDQAIHAPPVLRQPLPVTGNGAAWTEAARLRDLAGLLGEEALRRQVNGRPDSALDLAFALLDLHDLVAADPRVQASIKAEVARSAAEPIVLLAAGWPTGRETFPDRSRVKGLLARLLTDQRPHLGQDLAYARLKELADLRGNLAGAVLTGPVVSARGAVLTTEVLGRIAAQRKGEHWAGITPAGPIAALGPLPNRTSGIFRDIEDNWRVQASWRHIAAVAVSAACYRADHAGAWPQDFKALSSPDVPALAKNPAWAGRDLRILHGSGGPHVDDGVVAVPLYHNDSPATRPVAPPTTGPAAPRGRP